MPGPYDNPGAPPPDSPPEGSLAPGGGPPNQLAIPVEALAVEGVSPGPGDPVAVQLEGTIDRVEGGFAFVSAGSANGLPVPPEQPGQAAPPPEEDRLMAEARAIDDRELL